MLLVSQFAASGPCRRRRRPRRMTWPLMPLLPLALSAALILRALLCPPALTLRLALMLTLTLCLMALSLNADDPGGSDDVSDGSDPEGAAALSLKSLR